MPRKKSKNNDKDEDEEHKGPPFYGGYYKNPKVISHNCLIEEVKVETKHYDPYKCDPYIDEISKPTKRNYYNTLKLYYRYLSEERLEKMKQRVIEEFSWSPEETEAYFEKLRIANEMRKQKKECQKELQKALEEEEKFCILNDEYRKFRYWIRRGLRFALLYSVPPLYGNKLKILSDIIMEQLAKMYCPHVEIPNRYNLKGFRDRLLASTSDWLAIFTENLDYEVVAENIECRRMAFDTNRTMLKPPEQTDEEEFENEQEITKEYETGSSATDVTPMIPTDSEWETDNEDENYPVEQE